MRDVNLTLISKLGWKFHSKVDSLWAAQLQGKYLHNSSFLSTFPSSSSLWLWKARKGILKSKPFISKGVCNKIHNFSVMPSKKIKGEMRTNESRINKENVLNMYGHIKAKIRKTTIVNL
jgi:hypothetical protein